MIALRRRLQSIRFVCLLVALLGVSGASTLVGDCDEGSLGELESSVLCLHAHDETRDDHPGRDTRDHHRPGHCVCACHTVGAVAVQPALAVPVSIGLLDPASIARLDLIDLPGNLRPPIAG